ncbi:MAG TPA: ABC transporter permease [Edaphobacter sp.]|uniref:ABC transporter permease n=1 Tax=Edaphobacter sp. TaxID=1934404 RepID=UPI002C465541|nr:ABC transporter permease [Edaphobacter sp.]HUZ96018.1 ABC transporter permease [Edaphobacter sp.]
MSALSDDVKHSIKMFFKKPGFTIAAVAALALGIGANTAIFSIVNVVLLKPLSYPNADRIVEFLSPSSVTASNQHSVPEFHFFHRQTSVFQEVAAYDDGGPGFNITSDRPEQIHGLHVTEGYFRLFSAPVILGRTFTAQEDSPHGGKVAVLSYGLWQRKFAGDTTIVGKSLSLGNEPYTIIGVIGKDFVADPQADIWLPFQFEPVSQDLNGDFLVAAMLKPGITLAQANAELMAAAPEYRREFPKINFQPHFSVGLLRDSIIGDARNSLLVMLGAVALVLLIACANVANLLLVRATGRKREFAIRSALGAGRARIVRQLLTESVLLSLAGGILGLALGFVGVRALLAISPAGLPRIGEGGSAIGMDWRVLAFTLAVSLLTGILFGLFPAFAATGTDLNSTLKESSNRFGIGVRQGKARSLLVISEVSLALVLLIGSALLIRTSFALHDVSPGFDSHNVLTMEMSLNGDRYQHTSGIAQLSRDGRNQLNAIPGVELSAAAYWLPNYVGDGCVFRIIGRPVKKDCCGSKWMSISPGYLNLFKISILRGRNFTENDKADMPGVALINEALAKKLWLNEDPLGQHVIIGESEGSDFVGEPERQIVGIVADFHDSGLGKSSYPIMMVPIAQVPDGYAAAYSDVQPLFWIARTHGDPHIMINRVEEELRTASHGFPVAHVRTMDEVMGRSTARQGFNMLLLSIFGAVALLLAAIGIYGLMAYSVAQRTQEMGIRMALGADRVRIRKLIIFHGMRLTMAGVAVGIAAAFGLTRLIASFLFGVKPWDPAVFVSVPLILTAVALLAVWLPAARASKVDPMQALRTE